MVLMVWSLDVSGIMFQTPVINEAESGMCLLGALCMTHKRLTLRYLL